MCVVEHLWGLEGHTETPQALGALWGMVVMGA